MDLNKIFECKNMGENSKNLYIKNIIKLNDNKPIKNLNFLKNHDEILKKIEKYKQNTKRTYIISIVSLLKCVNDNKFKKTLNYFYDMMMNLNKELKTSNNKTENEKENWMTSEELNNIYMSLNDEINKMINNKYLNNDQYNKLLDFLLLSLYLLNPPRRNKDYQNMKIIKVYKNDMNKDYNYLDITNNNFIFNNYKTQKTYKQQIFEVGEELMNIINLYMKYHPNKKEFKDKKIINFIVSYNGEPFKNVNDITRRLNKIFNKNIGVSMLRKIYLTTKYKDSNNEMKEDAEKMGTSNNVIENNYIKND
jgi:hypothetical protein